MSFLKKIQGLPETKRKIILWLIIILIGSVLAIFYIKNVQKNLRDFKFPKIEMPNIKLDK